ELSGDRSTRPHPAGERLHRGSIRAAMSDERISRVSAVPSRVGREGWGNGWTLGIVLFFAGAINGGALFLPKDTKHKPAVPAPVAEAPPPPPAPTAPAPAPPPSAAPAASVEPSVEPDAEPESETEEASADPKVADHGYFVDKAGIVEVAVPGAAKVVVP